MKLRFLLLAIAALFTLIGVANWAVILPVRSQTPPTLLSQQYDRSAGIPSASIPNDTQEEAAFQARSLAIREKIAAQNLEELDAWWRREKLDDPHKYLLPVCRSSSIIRELVTVFALTFW